MTSYIRILPFLFLLAACGQKEDAKNVSQGNQTPVQTTKQELQKLPAKDYRRIITLGKSLTELVVQLGDSGRLVALDRSCPRFPELLRPKVGYGDLLRAEFILQHNPDLVLSDFKGSPKSVIQQIQNKKIDYFVFNQYQSLDSTQQLIEDIALLLGKAKQGKILIDSIQNQYQQIQNVLRERKDSAKVVYIHAKGPETLLLAGTNTPVDAIIKLAGAKNAAQDIEGMSRLTLEDMAYMNPDFIIMSEEGIQNLQGKISYVPSITSSRAYRMGRMIILPEFELLSFGINSAKTALNLSKKIYNPIFVQPRINNSPIKPDPSNNAPPPAVDEVDIIDIRKQDSENP